MVEETAKEVDVAPETLEAAKQLMARRFKFIKHPDGVMKRVARIGAKHVARDMTLDPERYAEREQPDKPLPVDGLDPLDILRKEHQLPALPQVFLELQQAINADNTSADDLASVISRDPSLTAFLLRMVNSAFYSLPMQIDTISRAVTVIGVNQLSTLAVGTSVISLFKDVPAEVMDMEQFWKHSIVVGLLARRLCRMTGKGDPERAFVAGLLHDIGQLILLQTEPERASAVLGHARASGELLWDKEKALLGFDHATLGGMLLRKWNFPFVLVSAVLEHHTPKASQKAEEPGLVHCAEILATALGIGTSGEYYVQPPESAVWEAMELTPDRVEEMIADLDEELEDAFSILIAR
ncbi:HDOD domain-containing protein [Pseudodesulfovibrio cashew]|uniref:HDOD domain-containing protein n=1 Tax=Pseudodesulfovibrio cashew TaxID=2678688 RepID=A0A6I6JIU7_9BACT|nr:HDOD domain-containing protein [Pseudodesulfovibrio cashew]QGY40097.1 HDOD domain-containing protein [Pseudodesulfovibrio cashew]